MNELMDFLHMGGYAPYVWGAYGCALVILTLNLVPLLGAERRALRELQRILRLRESRP